jgi:hypothetical protein
MTKGKGDPAATTIMLENAEAPAATRHEGISDSKREQKCREQEQDYAGRQKLDEVLPNSGGYYPSCEQGKDKWAA